MYISNSFIHLISIIYLIVFILIIYYCRKYFLEIKNSSNPKYKESLIPDNSLYKEFFIPDYPTYNELYIDYFKGINNNNIKYLGFLPNSDSFVSKNNLWNILRSTKYSHIVPKTYLLDNYYDLENFKKEHQKDKLYILKKNIQNKKGLKLIQGDYNTIINTYNLGYYKLVQEFIFNTILDKQFVIRIYILAIKRLNQNKVNVYYNKYNKLLFAEKNLAQNNFKSKMLITNSKSKMLITNSKSKMLITNSKSKMLITNSKHNIPENPKNLAELKNIIKSFDTNKIDTNKIDTNKIDTNKIDTNKIDTNKMDILLGIKYIITKQCENENKLFNFSQFQLFGIDIICDSKLNCYLLEINKNPNMSNFHSKKEKIEKREIIKDMYTLVKNSEKLNSFISLQ